ncbi:alkaline phosphatase D family protein [Stakelama marina]|uniref:Alkaline phosphatase D family protein n=1 Tax=Stakelama marina TaxID=2826939 RepID=A0A8T4ICW0_9SPHN|nr:alkaline phosphatase D family protein [Stakelama marina]MBR0552477.1 alkaline phosphatase D family protein [Stakelama marina]
MTLSIDRRSLLLTGTLGIGAFAVPGFGWAATVAAAKGFTHSVASGEPSADSMLLWTRYIPADGGQAELKVELSPNADFTKVIEGEPMITGPWRDHTVKIVVAGLAPATRYFYRFVAPDGSFSPVGRTRTLPAGDVSAFKAAIFSCSNMPFGYFNAYGHAADRDDIDLAIHLGDYFYEYKTGGYAPPGGAVGGRWPEPAGEAIHLADYRLRYASYRADPDLQRLHQMKPMILQWDDHESANDSWEGGAQNHQPKEEGPWNRRRDAAMQAYREWLPVSETPWSTYEIGDLATLFRTETRLLGRTEQPDLAPLFRSEDPETALRKFRDGAWMDPGATMMGSEQEAWLANAMAKSVKRGKRWQVVGFGTIMGETRTPPEAASWIGNDASARTRAYVQSGLMASKVGLPMNFDNWGGYPAARARFLKSAQDMGSELIVISGDSHNAWAYDLGHDGKPAGVEFAGQSVTSPGFEAATVVDPKVVAKGLAGFNPELKWCDTSNRGYMTLSLTPDRATNEWLFCDTVLKKSDRVTLGHSATVTRGAKVMNG